MLGIIDPECGRCPAGQVIVSGQCLDCAQYPEYCPARTPSEQTGPTAGVTVGADASTTAGIIGAFGELSVGPARVELAGELGLGSEEGYEIPEDRSGRSSLAPGDSYWVFQTYLHGRYPIAVGANSRLSVYPLAGVRYYRFAYKDCDSSGRDCVFPAGALDLGAGLAYGPFALEAFTGLFGDVPDASIRARFSIPIGRR